VKLAELDEHITQFREGALQGCALVRVHPMKGGHDGGIAVALQIGENISETWQSGDLMFCWPDGEHTTVHEDQEIEVLVSNLWMVTLRH
jgi:hypothetical protein